MANLRAQPSPIPEEYCKLTDLTIKKTKEIYHNNNNLLFFSGIIYSFATVFHLIGMS